MIALKIAIFLIFTTSVLLSISINKDVFSPSKWFLAYFAFYFSDIYISEYSIEMHFLVILIVFSIFIGVFLDRSSVKYPVEFLQDKKKTTLKVHFLFYLMLLVPVLAQIYIIYVFGGLSSYVGIIKMRVLEFRGLGPILTLIKLYSPIMLVYFGFLLSSESNKKDWVLFFIALSGMIFLNSMSGARGTLLTPILGMIVIYHFLRKNINIGFLLIAAIALVLSAATLEVLRNQISSENNEIKLFSENESSRASFEFSTYGLISSKLILENPIEDYEYGATYLTILTNFIPRSIWPDKPDTGGVVLTNRYMSGVWNGASNFATGVAAEAMLNFGEMGLILVPLQILLIFVIMIKVYSKIYKNKNNLIFNVKSVILYMMIASGLVNLMTGEFTNVMMVIIINVCFLYLIFYFLNLVYGKL